MTSSSNFPRNIRNKVIKIMFISNGDRQVRFSSSPAYFFFALLFDPFFFFGFRSDFLGFSQEIFWIWGQHLTVESGAWSPVPTTFVSSSSDYFMRGMGSCRCRLINLQDSILNKVCVGILAFRACIFLSLSHFRSAQWGPSNWCIVWIFFFVEVFHCILVILVKFDVIGAGNWLVYLV